MLMYRPAERGQAIAHPTVISIATARTHRIVDAVGHDHMHYGHSGYSVRS
jgi:hypothetical protein